LTAVVSTRIDKDRNLQSGKTPLRIYAVALCIYASILAMIFWDVNVPSEGWDEGLFDKLESVVFAFLALSCLASLFHVILGTRCVLIAYFLLIAVAFTRHLEGYLLTFARTEFPYEMWLDRFFQLNAGIAAPFFAFAVYFWKEGSLSSNSVCSQGQGNSLSALRVWLLSLAMVIVSQLAGGKCSLSDRYCHMATNRTLSLVSHNHYFIVL